MNEDCSENEDSEERELEKAYQNVHVNVSTKQWTQLNIPSIIFSQQIKTEYKLMSYMPFLRRFSFKWQLIISMLILVPENHCKRYCSFYVGSFS